MTYSKKAANQNKKIEGRAGYLLAFFEEKDVLEDLLQNFPEVSEQRIRLRLDKVQRMLFRK